MRFSQAMSPIDPVSLPDLAHYRSHGIDRITAWCLTPFCCHQAVLPFEELAAHGADEATKLLAVKPRLHQVRRAACRFAAGLVAAMH